MKHFLIAALAIVFGVSSATLHAADRKPLVLLCIAAHPDDEDGATLAYYNAFPGVKTYTLFFTRGEGGQNETGPALYKDLAVIRTAETESASRVVGSEALFLNLRDFGYSKTATETYQFWGGREEVLRRLVYMIRRIKPDVIITNHHPWLDDGENHGNHQVVALAALDALHAAADSTYRPEQLREPGVELWQVRKLFMRVWDYKDSITASEANTGYSSLPDCYVPVGAENPATHRRYQEIANEALREHRTQGMGLFTSPVKPDARVWYKLMQADANYTPKPDNLFSGLSPTPRHDDGYVTASSLPLEFTSTDYLDAFQPVKYAWKAPAVREGIRVGVVRSYDNTIEDALTQLNVSHALLDSAALTGGDLSAYATILVDIRAYSKRADLRAAYKRLIEYVVNGGNLVVFYQKTMEWKPEYAPFPITITRQRVTDENAPLVPIMPADGVFTMPNAMQDDDWKNWIVERGLYFPAHSNDYRELFATGDPGEQPLMTGLLKARYGNGTYWYCALSVYRQLRQLHPGAYKFFANLISYKTN